MLDAHGIEARSVRFDSLAVPIEVFDPHPDRPPDLAAQPVNAETSLPAFGSHRGVAEDFRVDHDGSREAALALALHDHNLLRAEYLRRRQADALGLDHRFEHVVNEFLEDALADLLQGNWLGDLPQHRCAELRNLEDRHRSTP